MELLPTKKASALLDKAWDLDQEALLRTKNKPKADRLWQETMKICKKLLKDFPKDINLLLKIATIYQHQSKFDEAGYYLDKAQKFYQSALLKDPAYRTPYNSLAVKYHEEKKYGAAEREHYKVLELHPDDAYAHYGLGLISFKIKKRKNF